MKKRLWNIYSTDYSSYGTLVWPYEMMAGTLFLLSTQGIGEPGDWSTPCQWVIHQHHQVPWGVHGDAYCSSVMPCLPPTSCPAGRWHHWQLHHRLWPLTQIVGLVSLYPRGWFLVHEVIKVIDSWCNTNFPLCPPLHPKLSLSFKNLQIFSKVFLISYHNSELFEGPALN